MAPVVDGCGDGCSLGATEFQRRLHVFLQKRGLDGHLVGQISVDDASDALENMPQFQIPVAEFAQVYHAHRHHFGLVVHYLDDAVTHDVRAGVYAEYYLLHGVCVMGVKGRRRPPGANCTRAS